MAPHEEATLRRLQYTVYLTGVFLSMPWKRLLSLNHKQQTIEFKRFRESSLEHRISFCPDAWQHTQSTWQYLKSMKNCNSIQFYNRSWQRSQKFCASCNRHPTLSFPETHETIHSPQRKDYFARHHYLSFSVEYLQLQSERWALSFPKFYQFLTQAFNQCFLFVRFQDKKQRNYTVHYALNICTKRNTQLFKIASSNHHQQLFCAVEFLLLGTLIQHWHEL